MSASNPLDINQGVAAPRRRAGGLTAETTVRASAVSFVLFAEILAGARAQAILMLVWRTCWQQQRSALDFLSHLLRGGPAAMALPP
jgi:hypothetical protein